MKFLICRTSQPHRIQPCKEAFESQYTFIDERTVDDPKKLPINNPAGETTWWYAEGKNHRVENGHMKRDFEKQGWFVELPDLESVLGFVDKYGDIILGPTWGNDKIIEIEIYDGYRE